MDQFLGEIRIFGFTFAPKGWALCQGQLMSVQQNSALFSLLGITYGGDGRSTFALPNLQGNVPINSGGGAGPGLQQWQLGEQQGVTTVTLQTNQLPIHQHALQAVNSPATVLDPANASLAQGVIPGSRGATAPYYQSAAPNVAMSGTAVGQTGGNQPHDNMMPYLAMSFCISLTGVYPARP